MHNYKININAHRWQGQARTMAEAVRKAASVCGVSLDQCGLVVQFWRV